MALFRYLLACHMEERQLACDDMPGGARSHDWLDLTQRPGERGVGKYSQVLQPVLALVELRRVCRGLESNAKR